MCRTRFMQTTTIWINLIVNNCSRATTVLVTHRYPLLKQLIGVIIFRESLTALMRNLSGPFFQNQAIFWRNTV